MCAKKTATKTKKAKNNIVLIYMAFHCIAHQYRNKQRRKKIQWYAIKRLASNYIACTAIFRNTCNFPNGFLLQSQEFYCAVKPNSNLNLT